MPLPAASQTVVNPTEAEFEASPDHNATDGGVPAVESYELGLYLAGASAPFQTIPLGKPSPNSSGVITVDLRTIFTGWPVPGTNYTADVAAVGPGGTSRSNQSNTFTFASDGTCSFIVSETSKNATAAGGPLTTGVTTSSGCNWTAVSNAGWITVTSGADSTGSGSADYSVSVNPSSNARTGTLTIAGQTITVTQAGACTFSVSPTSHNPGSAAATLSSTVTTGSGCEWSAVSNAGWITRSGSSDRTGPGSVSFSITANTSSSQRTGTLTVAGETITVTQEGSCVYTVSPTSHNPGAGASTLSSTVTTVSGCDWSASDDRSWITISGSTNRTGTGTLSFDVAANTSGSSRTGTVTIAGQAVSITQAANCTYTVSPLTHTPGSGSASLSSTVTTGTGCNWSVTSNEGWITPSGSTNRTGTGTVNFSITANGSSSERTGTLTIAGRTVTVTQDASCTFSVTPTSFNQNSAAASLSVEVTTASSCGWTAVSNSGWIDLSGSTNRRGSGTVTFSITARTVASSRSGTLTIAGKTVRVSQAGALPPPGAPSGVRVVN